ncbi:MAG TPA: SDR family oxidoreductase [Candidatus Acidoferrum sp.]|nr:SDR family oxidoreductase [Candidatus Acidoferrum sp.]
MSTPDSLKGREVILTGGSGGIGAALAAQLRDEAARLVISYRANRDRAAQWEGSAAVIQADLTSVADRTRLLDAAPSLYALVVFAGDPARVADPSQLEAAMQRSHDANYLGPILLAREAAERMRASSTPGAIVLISTMQANALFPGSTVYAAQKAALQHAALILARECRGASNIRVNVVSPGITAAGMAEASIASRKYDRFLQDGTLARFGRAEDVARAVRFFLEPDNYVTGQVLCVDGGITL